MNSNRRLYLDNIRWITVVIVVVYHVIYMFNGVQPYGVIGPFYKVQYQDAFQYIVYPWFMLILFVVSGMSARYYLEGHSIREFIRSKNRKLLVPSTIGLFVFHWTTGYFNVRISGALDEGLASVPGFIKYLIFSVSGTGVLWYIQVLWVFSLLLALVKLIEKDRLYNICTKIPGWILILFVPLVWGFAQILNTPVITVYRFGIYGFGFFVGYFIMSHEEVMNGLCKLWIPLDIFAIGLGSAYTVIYFGDNYAMEPVINNILASSYAWIAVLGVMSTMRKFADKTNSFAAWMGKKSWGLYIFHYLPLAASAYGLHKYASNMPAIIVYIIVGIASFAGAFALYELISRIPVIRWCVLGIKKEKKNV